MILCKQGDKGCSACCGLFNFKDISRQHLTAFLDDAAQELRSRECMAISKEVLAAYCNSLARVRDAATHICPYQKFVAGAPGCPLHVSHSNDETARDASLYESFVCGDFLCPAHKILSDEYKAILTEYIDDWYFYSIAIIDPESFIWIADYIKSNANPDKNTLSRCFASALEAHAAFLAKLDIPLFYYSVSEYNLNKHLFSLNSDDAMMAAHRNSVINHILKNH